MFWFAVFLVHAANGRETPTDNLSGFHYRTRAECLVDAAYRGVAFQSAGAHGRFVCTYHNEPDAELRHEPYGEF